jgi:hypothetical protein
LCFCILFFRQNYSFKCLRSRIVRGTKISTYSLPSQIVERNIMKLHTGRVYKSDRVTFSQMQEIWMRSHLYQKNVSRFLLSLRYVFSVTYNEKSVHIYILQHSRMRNLASDNFILQSNLIVIQEDILSTILFTIMDASF